MKRYAPFRFRPAFALGAVALTAATLSLMVVAPAALSPEPSDATAVAATQPAIEVTIFPYTRSSDLPVNESVRYTSFRS